MSLAQEQKPPEFIQKLIKTFTEGGEKKEEKKERSTATKEEKPKPQVGYAGYSKVFAPIKKKLEEGQLSDILQVYEKKDKGIKKVCRGNKACYMKKIGLLGCLERGSLLLDMGNFNRAVNFFSGAEFIIRTHQDWSKTRGLLTKVGSFLAETVTGYEQISSYETTGFERILMLNYKTIAFLLTGDRKAYNVTRRAIDWQEIERRMFENKYRKVVEKSKKKEEEAKKKGIKNGISDIMKQVSGVYKKTEKKASTVASAYVNPFGYYIAGLVHEVESLQDKSLIYNAIISYQKALELNPRSRVIKDTIANLKKKKRPPQNYKLVYVVVNEGFAPEKKVITYYFSFENLIVPVKFPIYDPVKSDVGRIKMISLEGRNLASLSPIADVEALVLRHQKDNIPFMALRIIGSILRVYGESQLVGNRLALWKEKMLSTPDTRSWMMLPKVIWGARFYVPEGVRKVKIVVYNKKNKKLCEKIVSLDESQPTFIYGRCINNFLIIHANQGLWLKK